MKALGLILILAGLLVVSACSGGGDGFLAAFDSIPDLDAIAPVVESNYPDPDVDGNVASADIQANGIKVIFDEGMDPVTIDSASFIVEEWTAGGTAVSGVVTYDTSVRTAQFIPDSALATSWDYVVTITTAVTDLAGNNLAADHTWLFMVAAAAPPGSGP